ncbi:MAG: hypothetical protein A2365_00580 [Candidatus Nealsonbacteria bacterium RIFOXYB1_FULL_40_15]|uniref:Transketolase N-terminal domain-containing protein n=2 Tax=Candidatus Nealsoniibacteriota TaxID=1817911 RepID=A0A1G2ESI3_9BACT|nr:MAG: hypothetical protein A2365_00580 [Candidatus Nealsonbacteria bacterium RIFOXYB1_FULL_40_15]OGZ28766.1 MAG: hypothetical protein A2427_01760 [Candidatus Nealsonbacteria bacterium RIFOXYC1_FULL_40_7]OGZ29044.1 MAG: hypothetical protein A2562_01010 [Candidatus Nealsonbacteria bacterium RIFOXYD1_FULL_39_11]
MTLEEKARWVRSQVLETAARTKKGEHIGGIFSCTDILVALYYGNILKVDPKNPKWDGRDRFVLGKGHASLALYHILADIGFFEPSRIQSYGKNGSSLGVQLNLNTPGVEYNTGSLGHAIGVACGMALSAEIDGNNYRSFALVGDGECEEGSIWESIMFAGKKQVKNLVGIIDRNRLSVTEKIEDKLEEKIRASGWECKTVDGHSFKELLKALSEKPDHPLMIIADTIKGKGVSFMENNLKWHSSALKREDLESAKKELWI